MASSWVRLAAAGLVFAAGFAATPALAQEVEAASVIPPEIPTSAFASQAALRGAELSPDGSMFAYSTRVNGSTYIVVHDADSREMVNGFNIGDELDFGWFRWAGNDTILFSMTGTWRDDYRFTRLYAFNLPRQQVNILQLRRMELDGNDIVHIDPDGRYVLVSIAESYRDWPDVWRFDLDGEGEPEGEKVLNKQDGVFQWIADNTGVVRIGLRVATASRVAVRYRSSADDDWREIARTRFDNNDEVDLWDFYGLRAGSDMAYSLAVPPGAQRRALMEFDFNTGEVGRIVHQSEEADITSVTFDAEMNPISLGLAGDDFRREWLDEDLRTTVEALRRALPGSWVSLRDWSRDRSRMLVLQSGPADPGALYVFTPGERRLDLMAELRPQVQSDWLSEPEAIRYDARDGTSIHAYLTLPQGREPEGLPLIVHPHGGPYGVRDSDNYDDTVQLLANRGYAVIQPNYRGSGGYGEDFEDLGYGQIGRAMQDDLDDAVAYLVSEGIADPERVCIVGGSYGGFAAVWGAIRNPEIYRCAASWAGVMHFERQLGHDRNFLWGRNRNRWANRVDGDQTNFDLDDVSPAVQVARLTRPVLLAHGEEDNTVPFNQFTLMVSRAENADVELETLVLEESGHNFAGVDDEQAWYDALVEFLERHNPAD